MAVRDVVIRPCNAAVGRDVFINVHFARLVADDPGLTITRTSARGLAASAKVPVQSWGIPRRAVRIALPAVAPGSVRTRVAIGRDVLVVAAAQGEYKGLHLPGQVAMRHSWHPRLDVVLLEDELRIAGNGLLATFPLSEMVLASYCTSPAVPCASTCWPTTTSPCASAIRVSSWSACATRSGSTRSR